MPSPPTAGDFLTEAGAHMRQAATADLPPRRAARSAAAHAFSQVTAALARYLRDVIPRGPFTEVDVARIGGWPRAALDAHSALSRVTVMLKATSPPAATRGSDLASSLAAAARSLSIARDLLHTHFTHDSAGGRVYASEWAPVLATAAMARAITSEVSWYTAALAPIAARLGQAAKPGHGRAGLLRVVQLLWQVTDALDAEQLRDPVHAPDLVLLRAIPLNDPPARALPTGAETIGQLCEGASAAAVRIRHVACRPRPGWEPEASTAALRADAAAGVITSHNCGTALALLADAADLLGNTTIGAALDVAAQAAADAKHLWLAVARTWGGQLVSDTGSPQSHSSTGASDLAIWTGRLVYADPQWAPAHGRRTALRQPTGLAADAATLRAVIAAVHEAGETLNCLAATGHDQLRALAAEGRLHVPTRSLPEWMDIPRAYGPMPPGRLAGLLATYQAAAADSALLAAQTGEAALATGAPSSALAAARKLTGRPFAARAGLARAAPYGHAAGPGPAAPVPGLARPSGCVARPTHQRLAPDLEAGQ